jgi:hypothetical protein
VSSYQLARDIECRTIRTHLNKRESVATDNCDHYNGSQHLRTQTLCSCERKHGILALFTSRVCAEQSLARALKNRRPLRPTASRHFSIRVGAACIAPCAHPRRAELPLKYCYVGGYGGRAQHSAREEKGGARAQTPRIAVWKDGRVSSRNALLTHQGAGVAVRLPCSRSERLARGGTSVGAIAIMVRTTQVT